jgi:hypothetical protein
VVDLASQLGGYESEAEFGSELETKDDVDGEDAHAISTSSNSDD